MTVSLLVRSVAGPDAGWVRRVPPGVAWLGRVASSLQVIDPAVEAHHAIVEVGPDGSAAMLQTAGRVPILVDGTPARGWTPIAARSDTGETTVVEVGSTRLHVGEQVAPTPSPTGWVFVPLDDSDAELERFDRDVARAVDASRAARACAPTARTVELGIGRVRLPVALRDGSGRDVSLDELSHPAASIVDRRACVDLPVRTTVDGSTAIVGDHAAAVAHAILEQLGGADRSRVIVVDHAAADEFESVGRPVVVVAADRSDVPPWCRAVLDMGSTWRGVWQPDAIAAPHDHVPLHVAGRRLRRAIATGAACAEAGPAWPVLSCRRQVAVRH